MKAMILYDVLKNAPTGELTWAYAKRAKSLQHYAPPDIEISIAPSSEPLLHPEMLHGVQVVLLLEYAHATAYRKLFERTRTSAKLLISHNSDRHRRHELWESVYRAADLVVANNFCVWEFFGRKQKTVNISNGIDARWWNVQVPIAERSDRILWCGSTSQKKGKGFQDVLLPAKDRLEELGFECAFRPIDDINERIVYPTEKQAQWYNGGSIVVCASRTEGTPGTSLEGMSCGCCLVTTRVGNAIEFGRDRENVVFFDRNPDSFIDACLYAREHKRRLSAAGIETMQQWRYDAPGNRAQFFYSIFRAMAAGRVPKPFTYMDTHWEEI